MKIHTFSFSPTGTSSRVLNTVSSVLAEMPGAEIRFTDLTHKAVAPSLLDQSDIAIVAAPVYGGKIAPILKQRLESLRGDGTRCILIAVYGNRAFEKAPVDLADFMTGHGFIVSGVAAFIGEHSYSTAQTPIAQGRPDDADIELARQFGREIASRIMSGTLRQVDASELPEQPSPETSLLNFRNFVMDYQRRQTESPRIFLPEVDTSLCDDCGTCADVCPTEAITIADLHNADPAKCIKCCACVKACPQNARTLVTPFARPLSENFSKRKSPCWIL